MKLRFYNLFCFSFLVLIISSCANIVEPLGGAKDVTPPKYRTSTPPNYSSRFQAKKVKIEFNEYFTLKDAFTQIIISPPFEKIPEFKIKGKSLVFSINEELFPSSTYNIYFGNSIQDITEGNVLENFQYAFATGEHLDTLFLKGYVNSAFDLKLEEGVVVMLYKNIEDSLPYNERPYYLTKTSKDGSFSLNSLAMGSYKIFALLDLNNNYKYDASGEKIAYMDSLVIPDFPRPIIHDSIKADSIVYDSLKKTLTPVKVLRLNLFEEIDSVQRITKFSQNEESRIDLVFRFPTQNLEIKLLNPPISKNWDYYEINKGKDSVIIWIKDNEQDTFRIEVSDKSDILDTLTFSTKKIGKKTKLGVKTEIPMSISANVNNNGQLPYFNNLEITFAKPLLFFNFKPILFESLTDTVWEVLKPRMYFADSLIPRKLIVQHNFEEDKKYRLFIPPKAFQTIDSLRNDTFELNFSTTGLKLYGNLKITLDLPKSCPQYILQLMNENNKLIDERLISLAKSENYKHLLPGKYKLKIIFDENKNGLWDTGNYLQKLQPEKVLYYEKELTIRANWDQEIDWKINLDY